MSYQLGCLDDMALYSWIHFILTIISPICFVDSIYIGLDAFNDYMMMNYIDLQREFLSDIFA